MKIIELRYWEVSACTWNFKEWLLNSWFAKHELPSFINTLKQLCTELFYKNWEGLFFSQVVQVMNNLFLVKCILEWADLILLHF